MLTATMRELWLGQNDRARATLVILFANAISFYFATTDLNGSISSLRWSTFLCLSRQPVEHPKPPAAACCRRIVVGVRLLDHWLCADALRTDAIGTWRGVRAAREYIAVWGEAAVLPTLGIFSP